MLASLALAVGLFAVFAGCTVAITPAQGEGVMQAQLFTDLLAAVALVVVAAAVARWRRGWW